MSAWPVVCPDCDDPAGLVVVERVERLIRLRGLAVAEDGAVRRDHEGWGDVVDGTEREVGLGCRTCGWRSEERSEPGWVDGFARWLAGTAEAAARVVIR